MSRYVSVHLAGGANEQGAVALDVSGDARAHFSFIGHDGVEKLKVTAFFDHETMAADGSNVISDGTDDELTGAVDIPGDAAVNREIPAVNFCGAEVTVFSDQHIAACANGGGGVQIDLEILQTDIDSTGRAVGGFRRATYFKIVVTVEAFKLFEMMLAIGSLLFHFKKGALLRSLLTGGRRRLYTGVPRCTDSAPDRLVPGICG